MGKGMLFLFFFCFILPFFAKENEPVALCFFLKKKKNEPKTRFFYNERSGRCCIGKRRANTYG